MTRLQWLAVLGSSALLLLLSKLIAWVLGRLSWVFQHTWVLLFVLVVSAVTYVVLVTTKTKSDALKGL